MARCMGAINGPDNVVEQIAIGGDLGAVGQPLQGIRVDENIKYLSVGGDVNGIVTTIVYEQFGLTGSVGRIEVDGDFNGVLQTESDDATPPNLQEGGIFIGGDLTGSLTLREGVTKKLHVGGSFASGAAVNLPAGGVEGQITFNRGASTGTWSGQIVRDLDSDGDWEPGVSGSTDAVLLEEYTELPSAIGGGAAGKAPFSPIHESTASPANDSIIFITEIDVLDPMMSCDDLPDFDDPITFRMYGPVSLVSGTGPHAEVYVWDGAEWDPASFDVTTTIVSGTGSRGLRFVRSDQNAWPRDFARYMIKPATGRITSADVAGSPAADFEYFIEIADGCALMLLSTYDLNHDDTLCSQDIAEWTTNPVDFNNDSAADGDDVALLMGAVNAYND